MESSNPRTATWLTALLTGFVFLWLGSCGTGSGSSAGEPTDRDYYALLVCPALRKDLNLSLLARVKLAAMSLSIRTGETPEPGAQEAKAALSSEDIKRFRALFAKRHLSHIEVLSDAPPVRVAWSPYESPDHWSQRAKWVEEDARLGCPWEEQYLWQGTDLLSPLKEIRTAAEALEVADDADDPVRTIGCEWLKASKVVPAERAAVAAALFPLIQACANDARRRDMVESAFCRWAGPEQKDALLELAQDENRVHDAKYESVWSALARVAPDAAKAALSAKARDPANGDRVWAELQRWQYRSEGGFAPLAQLARAMLAERSATGDPAEITPSPQVFVQWLSGQDPVKQQRALIGLSTGNCPLQFRLAVRARIRVIIQEQNPLTCEQAIALVPIYGTPEDVDVLAAAGDSTNRTLAATALAAALHLDHQKGLAALEARADVPGLASAVGFRLRRADFGDEETALAMYRSSKAAIKLASLPALEAFGTDKTAQLLRVDAATERDPAMVASLNATLARLGAKAAGTPLGPGTPPGIVLPRPRPPRVRPPIPVPAPVPAPTPGPGPGVVPAVPGAGGVAVPETAWLPELPRATLPAEHPMAQTCQIVRQMTRPRATPGYLGLSVGPKAASRDDEAYKQFEETAFRLLTDAMNAEKGVDIAKPADVPLRGVTYRRLRGMKGDVESVVLVTIQDGRCVAYWFAGGTGFVTAFYEAVGNAKLAEEAP